MNHALIDWSVCYKGCIKQVYKAAFICIAKITFIIKQMEPIKSTELYHTCRKLLHHYPDLLQNWHIILNFFIIYLCVWLEEGGVGGLQQTWRIIECCLWWRTGSLSSQVFEVSVGSGRTCTGVVRCEDAEDTTCFLENLPHLHLEDESASARSSSVQNIQQIIKKNFKQLPTKANKFDQKSKCFMSNDSLKIDNYPWKRFTSNI